MSGPDEKHPKRWRWRFEWLCQFASENIVGWLPGPWVFRLGELLGWLAWKCLSQRRNTVLRNLRIAFSGEHDLPTLRRMGRDTFRRTGANLFSAARTARLAPAKLGSVIQIENLELLEQALADGKGVVLLLSHMGNWELLSRLVHLFPPGTRTGAFYRPLNNPLLDEDVLKRRQADGTRMFSKRDSPHWVTGFLREGGIVGILADQRVGVPGEVVEFFGRLTRASPLPSLLARRAKCSVLALSLTTVAAGRWSARFVAMGASKDTAGCMLTLEQAMRRGPLDVFWLQERWKTYIEPGFTIRDWLGDQALRSTKPHRALVWLVDAPQEWCLPETWVHPEVVYEVVLEPGQALPTWLPESTTIHTAPCGAARGKLRRLIAAIDLAAALPIDYLITRAAPKALALACRSERIPMVSLTS
ncbi:MAG: hypothetical protein WCP35_04550 [Verrucomicrobiota bacterium]